MAKHEQYQRERLTVHFVHRFVDNELLSAGAEPHQIFVTAVSLTAAFGFTLSVVLSLRYALRMNEMAEAVRAWAVLGDRQLLVLLTMTITGLFSVLAWDALLPDRKDALILGSLPVRANVVLRAKMFAAMLYFAVLQFALQFFALSFAMVSNPGIGFTGMMREVLTQAAMLGSVGLCVFCGAAAVQGTLALLLPYRWFLPVSSFAQLLWLLGSLSVTFLTPPVEIAAKGLTPWSAYLPVAWFTDLWQALSGNALRAGHLPGIWSAWLTAAVFAIAAGSLSLGFPTILRRVVQGQSAPRQGPGWLLRAGQAMLWKWVLRHPAERAIFGFSGRTLLRHRNTRLMLSVYGGLALCWTLVGLMHALQPGGTRGNVQNALLLSIPLDFSFLLLVGMRVMFAMPVELQSNWMFRLYDRNSAEHYWSAVRKLMWLSGCLPLALLLAPGYLFLLGPGITIRHTILVLLAGWLIVEILLKEFHKVPFACSWMPGKANLKVTLGAWVFLFTSLSWLLGNLEAAAVRRNSSTAWVAVFLCAWIGWRIWQRRGPVRPGLVWEETPHTGLQLLQLGDR